MPTSLTVTFPDGKTLHLTQKAQDALVEVDAYMSARGFDEKARAAVELVALQFFRRDFDQHCAFFQCGC